MWTARHPGGKRLAMAPEAAARVIEQLRRPAVSTVLLGLGVALASWWHELREPAPNLDPSAQAGLYLAIHDGINFGSDIVFTYGPLGFLTTASGWFTDLQAIAFVWLSTIYVLLACALVWALRRTFGALAAVGIAFLTLALLGVDINAALALGAIVGFEALRRERPRLIVPTIVLAGSLLAAIETLIKVSVGPALFVVLLIALVGAHSSRRQLLAFAGLFAEVLLLWWLSGQAIADLPAYVANSRELISGYSEAIGFRDPSDVNQTVSLIAAALMVPALVAAAATVPYRDRLARWAGIVIATALGFSLFKEGSILAERHHFGECFGTALVVWIALPWPSSPRTVAVAGIGAAMFLAVGTFSLYKPGTDAPLDRFEVRANLERAVTEAGDLFHPAERERAAEATRVLMKAGYRLDDRMLSQVEGHTVAVDPWEVAAAWAYELDWDPLPVFQNYAAYTEGLDRINSERAAAAAGPDRILRLNAIEILPGSAHRGYLNRWQGWDPPGQALAALCNFEALSTSKVWQVLGRVPERCGEPELISSFGSSYGEAVDVPAPGPDEVVFARIDGAGVSGLESLRTLLWRSEFRFAVFDNGRKWRLVPGTAGDGLLLRGDPKLTGKGEFAQAPQTTTLELGGPSGDLRYDFYSMSIERTPGERARAGGRS